MSNGGGNDEGFELAEGLPECVRTWHSPLLTFYNETVEKKYRVYFLRRANDTDRRSNRVIFLLVATLCAAVLIKFPNRGGFDRLRLLVFGSVFLVLLVHRVYIHRGPKDRFYLRYLMVVGLRCALAAIQAMSSRRYHRNIGWTQSTPMFWVQCLRGTGVVASAFTALGFPLLFQHQLLLHTMVVVLQMKLLARRFCNHLVLSDKVLMGPDICPGDGGSQGMPFSAMMYASMIHMKLRGAVNAITGGYSNDPSLSPEATCRDSALFLQLVLGWWLPTVSSYVSERRSRFHFLLNVERDHDEDLFMLEVERELAQSTRLLDRVRRTIYFLVHLCGSLMFLVMTWALLALII